MIPFLSEDNHSKTLICKIETKLKADLEAVEAFVTSEMESHHLANTFLQNFDIHIMAKDIFEPGGAQRLKNTIQNFVKWNQNLSGNLHTFGSCSMSTAHFAAENKAKLKAHRKMIETSAQYRKGSLFQTKFSFTNFFILLSNFSYTENCILYPFNTFWVI